MTSTKNVYTPEFKKIAHEPDPRRVQNEELPDMINHSEEEARMVLPGIQALFGFQLIAVFNAGFKAQLTSTEQLLHLAAIACVAVAATLVLTPVAYHRQAEPQGVSGYFVNLASRLLASALAPLTVGMCLDFYLISRIVVENRFVSALLALALFAFMATMWWAFPRHRRDLYRRASG